MKIECPDCDGLGEVTAAGSGTLVPTQFGPRRAPYDDGEAKACESCNGTGFVDDDDEETEPCSTTVH